MEYRTRGTLMAEMLVLFLSKMIRFPVNAQKGIEGEF